MRCTQFQIGWWDEGNKLLRAYNRGDDDFVLFSFLLWSFRIVSAMMSPSRWGNDQMAVLPVGSWWRNDSLATRDTCRLSDEIFPGKRNEWLTLVEEHRKRNDQFDAWHRKQVNYLHSHFGFCWFEFKLNQQIRNWFLGRRRESSKRCWIFIISFRAESLDWCLSLAETVNTEIKTNTRRRAHRGVRSFAQCGAMFYSMFWIIYIAYFLK